MSETYTAPDGNENHSQETVVGIPVSWNWFLPYDHQSRDVTRGLLDNSYESGNDTQRLNNDISNQSSDVARRLPNDTYQSSNRTQRMNRNSQPPPRNVADDFLRCTWGVVFVLVMVVVVIIFLGKYTNLLDDAPLFKFEVISLEVESMTISNNDSSDIHKYMSNNLNLTLGMTNTNQQLLIEPLLVSIKYGGDFLSSIKTDSFYAVPEAYKTIVLDMGIRTSQLTDVTVDSIAKSLAINQALEFTLIIEGHYWILNNGWQHEYDVAVICEGVKVKFSAASNFTAGSMIGSPGSCKLINT